MKTFCPPFRDWLLRFKLLLAHAPRTNELACRPLRKVRVARHCRTTAFFEMP